MESAREDRKGGAMMFSRFVESFRSLGGGARQNLSELPVFPSSRESPHLEHVRRDAYPLAGRHEAPRRDLDIGCESLRCRADQ